MAQAAPAAPGHSSARGRETRRALLHPRFPPLLWALLRSRRHATSTWTRRRSPGCSSVRLSHKAPVPPLCDPTMWTRRWATARRRAAAGSCRARARRGLPSAKTRTRPRSCPWRRSGSTCSSTRAEQHVVPFAPRPGSSPRPPCPRRPPSQVLQHWTYSPTHANGWRQLSLSSSPFCDGSAEGAARSASGFAAAGSRVGLVSYPASREPSRRFLSPSVGRLDSSTGPYTSPSWSGLPIDMFLIILQRLELPQALVFAAVCMSWRQAAIVAGIPSPGTPWLVSWRDLLEEREDQVKSGSPVTCKLRRLPDVDEVYDVTFPRSSFVCCCGASHGWLVLVNEQCNLVLHNLFTLAIVPLPPVTDFTYVEAVYDGEGNIEGYLYDKYRVYKAKDLASFFYQKAVLSCSPSRRGECMAVTIHRGGCCVSFARVGEGKWQLVSTLDGTWE